MPKIERNPHQSMLTQIQKPFAVVIIAVKKTLRRIIITLNLLGHRLSRGGVERAFQREGVHVVNLNGVLVPLIRIQRSRRRVHCNPEICRGNKYLIIESLTIYEIAGRDELYHGNPSCSVYTYLIMDKSVAFQAPNIPRSLPEVSIPPYTMPWS